MGVSAALFGLLHALQPSITLWSITAIALEAGILLGAAYTASRSLWLPIGLHLAWNFTEGGIFGAFVSGGGGAPGLFAVKLRGPELLTGGDFGPESSVIAVGLCATLAFIFVVVAVRRGNWRPAFRTHLQGGDQ